MFVQELDIALSLERSVRVLEAAGYRVYPTEDFEEVLNLFHDSGRLNQSPMLSVARLDLTGPQAFWIFIMKGSTAVAGLGAKYIDLGVSECFEGYLRRTSRLQYNRSTDPILSVAEPLRRVIERRLIYLGELEMHPSHRGKRSVLVALAKLVKGMAVLKWPDFDQMYAFIPDHHFQLARLYGFDWQYPNAITWRDPVPDGRLNSHWIMGCNQDGFLHSLKAEKLGSIERKPK